MKRHIHIISFNVPYPADYGGVIDVYYKIKALNKAGFKITLHCFRYGRKKSPELEKLCQNVFYYRRKTGFRSHLTFLPYIIFSRRSSELIKNIQKDNDPIIFEGLHSSFFLPAKELRNRLKIVRTHNVEHKYYFKLFIADKNIWKKVFFLIESLKLFFAERTLKHADYIAAISKKEQQYFKNKFNTTFLLNAFHSNEKTDILPGKGKYLLYHGNLSVPENKKAVSYLIDNVFKSIDFHIIIAGKSPSDELVRKIEKYQHLDIVASPDQKKMKELIKNAHAIVLYTFQDTGSKLKIIESLFNGRFCIANPKIFGDSGLNELCETGNSAIEILIKIRKILNSEFTEDQIRFREKILRAYDNGHNARLLGEKLDQSKKKGSFLTGSN